MGRANLRAQRGICWDRVGPFNELGVCETASLARCPIYVNVNIGVEVLNDAKQPCIVICIGVVKVAFVDVVI
jgi:hypothetical protein